MAMGQLAVTIMEVFGLVGIAVVAVLAAAAFYIALQIWRFKRAIKGLGTSFKELGEAIKKGVVPDSLGLQAAEAGLMNSNPKAMEEMRRIEGFGLRFGGCYTSTKMDGLAIATYSDTARQLCAAITVVPDKGVMLDAVTIYEDGSMVTHRTMQSLGLDVPPQFRNVHVPGATADILLQRHLNERDTKPARRIEPEEVAAAMEEVHQTTIRWRNERGGLSEAEIRRNLEITGNPADDLSVKFVALVGQAEAAARLRKEMIARVQSKCGWSDSETEEITSRLVFVWDGMRPEELEAPLRGIVDDDAIARVQDQARTVGPRKAAKDLARNNANLTSVMSDENLPAFDAYQLPARSKAH